MFDIRLRPDGARSRLVIRFSADATGGAPRLVLTVTRFLDSVMARRELIGIRERVERHGARRSNPGDPETGARDQYQHYEVIYDSSERAGTPERARGKMASGRHRSGTPVRGSKQ